MGRCSTQPRSHMTLNSIFSFRSSRWSSLSPFPSLPRKSFYIHLVAPGMTGSSILETIIAIAANSMSCEDPQPTQLQNMQFCSGKRLPVQGWCCNHCLKVSAVQKEKAPELGVPT